MNIPDEYKDLVTKPNEWREKARKPVLVTLPSGINVMVRPVSTELILRYGNIPDSLTPIVEEFFTGKGKEPTTLSDLRKNIDFMNMVCELAFVYPKFSETPNDDSFGYDDLDADDKFFVFTLINKPTSVLERFHKEQESAMELVQPIENDDN